MKSDSFAQSKLLSFCGFTLLVVWLVAPSLNLYAHEPDPPRAASANKAVVTRQGIEEKVRRIKEVAQEEAAEADSALIIKPFFVAGTKNGINWIDYGLGGVAVARLGLARNDPYRLPYSIQLQAAALKKVFEEKAGNFSLWKAHLSKMEDLVFAAVSAIETVPDLNALDARLSSINKDFTGELRALETTIQNYAKSNNLQIGEPGSGRIKAFGEQEPFSVTVKTDPVGGKVRIVTAFVWKICLKNTSCNKEQLSWRTLNVGGTEGLIGGYHYIAEWNDGGRDEGDIKIDRDQERKFSPFRR